MSKARSPAVSSSYQMHVLRWQHAFAISACVAVVVLTLYLGQVILMPLALAIVFAFMLQPLVRKLEYIGLWRVPAVIIVVLMVGAVFAGMGWNLFLQLQDLAQQLRSNRHYIANVEAKLADLQGFGSEGMWTDFQAISERLTPTAPAAVEQPVKVQSVDASPWLSFTETLAPVLAPLGTAALVMVLLIFILINREDLRNRIIGVFGYGSLAVTTHAMDDAGHRIARYLLMQFVINASYGLAMAVVLSLLGVPFAILWGVLSAILRYIPYVGPWLGAILPITTALVAFPGWQQAVLVGTFIILLELFSNMVMEPLLYGHSVGISPVALIISAAFWTLLWGPIGLVLATPLTVCLMVLGQHVPQLKTFSLLLSDTPALPLPIRFYQRLLAQDEQEAIRLAETNAEETEDLCETFDAVLLHALLRMRRDREHEEISPEAAKQTTQAIRKIVRHLGDANLPEGLGRSSDVPASAEATVDSVPSDAGHSPLVTSGVEPAPNATAVATQPAPATGTAARSPATTARSHVLACPAHHEAEEVIGEMLYYALASPQTRVDVVSTRVLSSELVERIEQDHISLVFIAIVPPGGLTQAGFLCETLREAFPELLIVVGCWGRKARFDEILVKFRSRGADYVTTSLCQTRTQVNALLQQRRLQGTEQSESANDASNSIDR